MTARCYSCRRAQLLAAQGLVHECQCKLDTAIRVVVVLRLGEGSGDTEPCPRTSRRPSSRQGWASRHERFPVTCFRAEDPEGPEPSAFRLRNSPGCPVIEDQGSRRQLAPQHHGFGLALPNAIAQTIYGRTIMDGGPGDPMRLGHFSTPRSALSLRDDLVINRLRDVYCSCELTEKMESADAGGRDEDAGVHHEDQSGGPSRARSVERSR